MSDKPLLRIGLAGLGTVGATVAQQILAGAIDGVELGCVSAREPNKPRGFDISGLPFVADPLDMVADETIDVIVELIGGQDGPVY